MDGKYWSPSLHYAQSYESEPAHDKTLSECREEAVIAATREFVKRSGLLIEKMKQPNSSHEATIALHLEIEDYKMHVEMLMGRNSSTDVATLMGLCHTVCAAAIQMMLETKDAEIGNEVSNEPTLKEPLETPIVHDVCEEKIQEEENEVEVEEVNHDILVEKTRDPEMDKYTGLHSCIDMSKLAPSNSLPSSIVKQLILESKSIPDHMDISSLVTKTLRSFKGVKLHGHQRNIISTARGFIIKSFDPDGAKNRFILLLQSPSNKPWDPGICCNTLSVTCSSCFEQWDPGGSF